MPFLFQDIADIRKQFPVLAEDVHIPEYFEKEQFFSSVFRISSAGLQLWTHYDVGNTWVWHKMLQMALQS